MTKLHCSSRDNLCSENPKSTEYLVAELCLLQLFKEPTYLGHDLSSYKVKSCSSSYTAVILERDYPIFL